MSNVINLEVKASTETQFNNYSVKMYTPKYTRVVNTPAGNIKSEGPKHFYAYFDQDVEVGMKFDLDLSLFDIVEKCFTPDGSSEEMRLSYLYPKR